ncbi:MAG: nucleotidyltransferase domain-containing protein [Nanoarchaeota archaeon]|nr:nucleotidyltransferase domain-containing protein [Nanoarchaeota archaeon]
MLSKNQIEILNLFRKNIFLKLSILDLKKRLKNNSYQRIYEAVKELEKNNILNSEKIGNSNLITFNLSRESILELSYIEEKDSFSKKIPNIEKILDFHEFFDDIILITGSYSTGTQTNKSDMDLVIISKEEVIKKQKLIENITMLFIPKVHPIVISYMDFSNMLTDNKENYGKEIFKNHLLFRNSKRYYELIKEAIKNGFRG